MMVVPDNTPRILDEIRAEVGPGGDAYTSPIQKCWKKKGS